MKIKSIVKLWKRNKIEIREEIENISTHQAKN